MFSSRFIITPLVFCFSLTAWSQQQPLDAFGSKVPLATQTYDYSAKALRAQFDEQTLPTMVERLDGTQLVKRQQVYQGIPVWGATLIEIHDGDQMLAKTGHFARLYTLKTEPQITANQAITLTADYFNNQNATAEQYIYPARGRSYLIWLVKENNPASNWFVFVDAHTGEFLNAYQSIHTGTGTGTLGDVKEVESSGSAGNYLMDYTENGVRRITYSAGNGTSLPGTLSSDADDTWDSASQAAAVDAHHYAGLVLDFLRVQFNRSSFDNNGATIRSTVNYGEQYANAFWNGGQMVYGDGDGYSFTSLSASLDVVAHEIGHAVTQYTSNLIYQGQSGALNEAFSDILGTAAEYYYQSEQFDWMIGEECWTPSLAGDGMRYMYDPVADGQSRDHYKSRYTGVGDNGGVHINSGIVNLAFYLLTEGGRHPRWENYLNGDIEVRGLGMDVALSIFYVAMISLPPNARFLDARNACIAAATIMYDEYEVTNVTNAWAAVGIGEAVENGLPNNGVLTRGETLNNLSAKQGEWLELQINLPANATNLRIRSFGGTGDADMYTRFNAAPTETEYTQRPYRSGNDERVVESDPAAGIWYIGLRAYAPFENVSVSADFDLPEDPDASLPNETLALSNLSAAEGEWLHYTVEVYQTGPMQIAMSGGTGDADLYIKYEEEPKITNWDYRPFAFGNDENVNLTDATKGTWHISIHAAEVFNDVALTVSYP